jgi:hypothetical protein
MGHNKSYPDFTVAEKIGAKSIEDAIDVYQKLKRCAPYRFSCMKWIVKIDKDTFQLRATKPKALKDGQLLYKITPNT